MYALWKVLRVESEWFELEKRKSNSEKSQGDLILRRLAKEKEEAERLAAQVSSEVQILRHNSIMVEEKLVSMAKLHEQEVVAKPSSSWKYSPILLCLYISHYSIRSIYTNGLST